MLSFDRCQGSYGHLPKDQAKFLWLTNTVLTRETLSLDPPINYEELSPYDTVIRSTERTDGTTMRYGLGLWRAGFAHPEHSNSSQGGLRPQLFEAITLYIPEDYSEAGEFSLELTPGQELRPFENPQHIQEVAADVYRKVKWLE